MIEAKEILNDKSLIESFTYAQIIQQGLFPKKRHFNRLFKQHFVIYKPLHYISGDYYWIGESEGYKYVAVGDCTGHGIPGAMLSILSHGILEYVILSKKITNTHKILQEMDKKFIESFKNHKEDSFNNDWSDIALVRIDEKNMKLQISTANRKVMLVKKNKSELILGSKYPIGGWQLEKKRSFDSVEVNYEKDDCLYLGSDGFQDQFGERSKKKYGSKKLHKLLSEMYTLGLSQQKVIMKSELMGHQGNEIQTDDICIMGLRL